MRRYSVVVQFPTEGPQALEVTFPDLLCAMTPDARGAAADGITDDSVAFAEAFAESNVVQCVPGRTYAVTSPIIVGSGKTLRIDGAGIKAVPGFVGSAVVLVKEGDGSQPALHSRVTGGKVDANFLAESCIEVAYGRQCDVDHTVTLRPQLYGVNAGSSANPSTGVNVDRVEAWWHDSYDPVPGHEVNPAGSIGVRHGNCTDSYVTRSFAVGFRTGFLANAGSVEYSHCHPWGRRAHGPFACGFRANASNGTYTACYADTPHNWKWNGSVYVQDTSITEVYGFDLHAYSQHLANCTVSINTTDAPNYGATDGLVVPVNMGPELANGGFGHIFGLNLVGASTSYRYKKHFGGSVQNAVILGTNDGGTSLFVDNSTRGDRLRTIVT